MDGVATFGNVCDTMTQWLLTVNIYKGTLYFTVDPWNDGSLWGTGAFL